MQHDMIAFAHILHVTYKLGLKFSNHKNVFHARQFLPWALLVRLACTASSHKQVQGISLSLKTQGNNTSLLFNHLTIKINIYAFIHNIQNKIILIKSHPRKRFKNVIYKNFLIFL